MGNDTWNQAAAAIEDDYKEKTAGDGTNHLAYVGYQIHSAAVEQVQYMTQTKSNAGYYNRLIDIFFCKCSYCRNTVQRTV